MRALLLAVLLSIIPSALHAQCERMFPDGTRYALRAMSWATLAYDVDRDGRLDLLFALRGLPEVAVMLNRADGFHPAPAIGMSHVVEQLQFADVDGNGSNEIIALGTTAISTIFGEPDGTFRIVVNSEMPALSLYPQRRAGIGDVTGDGKIDVTGFRASTLYVLAGNGDGTFAPLATISMPNSILNLAVGELSGDAKADLAIVDVRSAARMNSNGDGTFATPVTLSATGQERNVAIADFDGDTRADIMTFGNTETARGVYLQARSFANPIRHTLESYSLIQDLDGDGDRDIARGLWIYRGAGDGTFAEVWRGAGIVFGMAAADFDGDGKGDLATTTLFNDVSIRYGTGPLRYDVPLAFATTSDQRELATADFNADGRMDVVSSGGNGFNVFLAQADGTLTRTASYAGGGSRTIAIADFNNDKLLDIYTNLGVLPGAAGGTFHTAGAGPRPNISPLLFAHAGDVDGDGHQDVVALLSSSAEAIVLLRGDGTGAFPDAKITHTVPLHEPHAITVADFDADGLTDVLSAGTEPNGAFTVRLSLGVRGGTFAPPLLIATDVSETARTVRSLAHGDVDGDGKLDFIIPDKSKREILVFRNLGNATFAAPRRIAVEGPYEPEFDSLALALADVTGDRRADIIVDAETFDQNTTVYAQQADGSFTLWQRLYYGSPLHDLATADVNGDSFADLVLGDGDEIVLYPSMCRDALRAIPPVMRMSVSPKNVFESDTLTFDITLDTPQATGTIYLIDGELASEMPPVIGETTVSNGRSSISVTGLGKGTHRLTAIYTGAGRYARAIAQPVEIIVSQPPAPGPRRRSTRK